MEIKKSPKADLERSRWVYVLAGVLFASALVLVSMEVKSYGQEVSQLGTVEVEEDDVVLPPVTRRPPPPPPPPVAPPQIEVVEDDVVIEEEIEIEEIDDDFEIPEVEEEVVEEVVEQVFTKVENMPLFPGCENEPSAMREMCTQRKMLEHAFKNFEYPAVAREHGLTGRIYLKFVVGSDGKVKDIEVLKGVHKVLDDAAVKAIETMPSMKPGEQLGKKVAVSYTIPFNVQAQ